MKDYEEFKSRALAACSNKEETLRVQEELDLFEQKRWEKYLVVIARLLENPETQSFNIFENHIWSRFRFSCCSTALQKALASQISLSDEVVQTYHFDDTLFVWFAIMHGSDFALERLTDVEGILEKSVQGLSLYKKEFISFVTDARFSIVTTVISRVPIRNEDCGLFSKEYEDCTRKEKERLARYLVVKTYVNCDIEEDNLKMQRYLIQYSKHKKDLTMLCHSERENQRLEEEFALFERRGWEKYFVLVCNIIKRVNKGIRPIILGGSCWDSYAVRQMCSPSDDNTGLISANKCHDILFNDAFRLSYTIKWSDWDRIYRDLAKLDRILNECLDVPGLFMKEVLIKDDKCKEERMIISFTPIPEEDIALIAHETPESTPKEAERLRKYLIITIRAARGI